MAVIQKALHPSSPFSTQFLSGDGAAGFQAFDAEIIHLHWICDGFLGIRQLGRFARPIVWTLHDQWPFTGGCHYSGECDRFTRACGRCPLLGERIDRDVSRLVIRAKERWWKKSNISIVCPSDWIAECAARSTLFRDRDIRVIRNSVDLRTFKPVPSGRARALIGLESTRPTLLFGAMSATTDPRKGFDLLESTLRSLHSTLANVQVVVIGASGPGQTSLDHRSIRYLGNLHDEAELALAYSAADVLVVPSRQDNLPNTVVESLACGTPVAAFHVGGIPEMVEHQRTGFLAEPFDTEQLARGISALLAHDRREQLSRDSRTRAEKLFEPQTVAASYNALYASLS